MSDKHDYPQGEGKLPNAEETIVGRDGQEGVRNVDGMDTPCAPEAASPRTPAAHEGQADSSVQNGVDSVAGSHTEVVDTEPRPRVEELPRGTQVAGLRRCSHSSHVGQMTECDNGEWRDEGHYGRVRFKRDSRGDVLAVVFQRTSTTEPVPEEMRQVITRTNATVRVIRQRFRDHNDKNTWLELVCSSARMGVLGEGADPVAGLSGLLNVEQMLVQAARGKRRAYILGLFASFVGIVIVSLLAYLAFRWAVMTWPSIEQYTVGGGPQIITIGPDWVHFIQVQIMTVIGLAVGVLFSGIVQNRILTLDNLMHFDPAGFSTLERLLYVWVVATVLELFIRYEVIILGVAGVSFSDVLTRQSQLGASAGILIGLVTALSTELVANMIGRSARPQNTREGESQQNAGSR